MSEPSVRFEIADGCALITLNRPERLNSFNPEMHQRLRDALGEIERQEEIRAVLLTGAGRAFSSGQDLSDRRTAPDAPPPIWAHRSMPTSTPWCAGYGRCRSRSSVR